METDEFIAMFLTPLLISEFFWLMFRHFKKTRNSLAYTTLI